MQIKFLTIPTECPICKEKLIIKTSSTGVQELFCPNEECNGKLLNRLQHFVSKKGLDIKGISKATLEKLMDWGWIENLEDIFKLKEHRGEWINKEGFGIKSVDRILAAIDAAANSCDFAAYISALGIPLIGKTVAKDLVQIFDTYEDFREAVAAGYEFWKLPNFGDAKHTALITFDYAQADIVRKYLNLTNEIATNTTKSLEGLTFVITGKLQSFKNRSEIKTLIENNGGKVTDSVSSKTSYLINNDINSTSAKNKTAKSLGVPILTEDEFKNLLN